MKEKPSRRAGSRDSFLRNHGLSVVMFALFALFWAGQLVTGWIVHNDELQQAGETALPFAAYLASAHALEATAENWESEFLQMCAFAVFSVFLFQRGSAESRNPDEPKQHLPLPAPADAPWPVRRGGWVLKVYEHSLSLALGSLFFGSFVLHVKGGVGEFNAERIRAGEAPINAWEFLGTAQLWFESLQNWQSEFLSIGAMVVLTIFLREKNSPESKRVEIPHHAFDE